jgi:Tfp pilus assembly protein PilN
MKTYVNLLPFAYRRRQLLWLRCKQWTAVASVALAIVAILCWLQMTRNRRDQLRLESLRSEYSEVKETADKVEVLKKDIDELKRREAIVLSLANEQPVLTLVALISQATRKCDGRLSVQRMQLEHRADGEPNGSSKVLMLEGIATDNHLVARFAAALRETDAFQRVELRSSGRRIVQDAEGQAYSVECVY